MLEGDGFQSVAESLRKFPMNKIQEVSQRVVAEISDKTAPATSGSGLLQTIISIITSLLGAGGMCNLAPTTARQRMIRQGPVERLSIWRTIKHHESNPAMWESLRSGITKVGSELAVEDYAAMMTEANG